MALGGIWLAGIDAAWRELHRPTREDLRRVALPTYPFERQRYWLELPEPAAQPATLPIPVSLPDSIMEPQPMQDIVRPTAPATTVAPASGRKDRILAALVEILEELSGTRIGMEAKSATFLELGFDSLFLTQVTRGLQNKIGLKVTFRQLLGQQNSLEALAAYADGTLPKDAFAELKAETTAPAPSPVRLRSPSPPQSRRLLLSPLAMLASAPGAGPCRPA